MRVQGEHSLAQALQFNTPNLLLDAWSDASYGGTGRNVDWSSAARFAAAQPSRRLILAGGLNPGNVGNAIRAVRPHAVDVASGVESSPGRKNIRRIRDFVRAVHESLCSDRVPAVEGALGGGDTAATNRKRNSSELALRNAGVAVTFGLRLDGRSGEHTRCAPQKRYDSNVKRDGAFRANSAFG